MNRYWLGLAAAGFLASCSGGNPFAEEEECTENCTSESIVPEAVAGDVDSITYDADSQTLTVSGVGLDETPFQAAYVRKPALDRAGYEAYTVQDSSLDRHSTAYVREIEGAYAVVVSTGGQFGYYLAGTNFGSNSDFSAPTTDQPSGGIVSYAGTYVGLLNIAGDGGDLLPVTPGTDPSVLPTQSAEVTGDVLVNADFADNAVNGIIYNRAVTDDGTVSPADLSLIPTDITESGTFSGTVSTVSDGDLTGVGDYAGVFAGTDAAAVAGSIAVGSHIAGYGPEIEEYGIFVLGQCGGAHSDPLCDQPNP